MNSYLPDQLGGFKSVPQAETGVRKVFGDMYFWELTVREGSVEASAEGLSLAEDCDIVTPADQDSPPAILLNHVKTRRKNRMSNKENDMKRPLDEEVIPEELVEKVSGGTGVDECYLNTAYGVNTACGVNTAYAFNTSKFF